MGRKRLTIPASLLIALLILGCWSCRDGSRSSGRTAVDSLSADPGDFPAPGPPTGFTLLAEATGDLDGDGIDELAVAWSGAAAPETGAARKLSLYRPGAGSWVLWHESEGPLMGSSADGQSGDPFHSLDIENGTILIHHIGGSREHWDYLHRYKLSGGDWVLISAVMAYGELCDTFTTINYDLQSGAIDLNRESNNCDETGTEVPGQGDARLRQFVRKQDPVKMDGFRPGANPIEAPDRSRIYY